MALQPIDYMSQIGRTGVSLSDLAQGLQIGQSIKQQRLQSNLMAQQQQQQEQARQDLASFMGLQNPTEKDYADFMTKYPAYADSMKQRYEMLSAGEQKQTWKLAGQLDTAVKTGNLDVAEGILQNEIDAYKNSGDIEGQKSMENLLKIFKSNPDAPLKMVNSMLYTADPERFAQNLKAIGEETRATELQPLEKDKLKKQIDEISASIGLSNAQKNKVGVEIKKLNSEIGKINADTTVALANLNTTGGINNPEKRFDAEEKLRKEATSRLGNYDESIVTFKKLEGSALDNTGAGDIALVTGFMKMLDPGSVVRETEFATARDTAGLYGGLQNKLTKLQNGQFLTPKQRQEYLGLAKKYMDATRAHADKVKKNIGSVADEYKLNKDNIFIEYSDLEKEQGTKQTQQTTSSDFEEKTVDGVSVKIRRVR